MGRIVRQYGRNFVEQLEDGTYEVQFYGGWPPHAISRYCSFSSLGAACAYVAIRDNIVSPVQTKQVRELDIPVKLSCSFEPLQNRMTLHVPVQHLPHLIKPTGYFGPLQNKVTLHVPVKHFQKADDGGTTVMNKIKRFCLAAFRTAIQIQSLFTCCCCCALDE